MVTQQQSNSQSCHYRLAAIPTGLLALQAGSHRQQQWQQQQLWPCTPAGGLHFAFRQTCHGHMVAQAPFARLSSSVRWPNELFSLSRLTSSGLASEAGSSEASGASSSSTNSAEGSSSGFESDADVAYSSDLLVDKIDCQICHQPLIQPKKQQRCGLMPWQWGRGAGRSSSKGPSSRSGSEFLVCDCCQRCFHTSCCQAKGISTKERKGVWFHSESCRECQQGLTQQLKAGAVSLPGGRSWQLIDCAPVDPSTSSGLQALKALKKSLSDVLDVLLPAYGPGAAHQLVDTNKGYAVLLRQGALPVTAGLLDVYGGDLAVLELVATAIEQQGQGHCKSLLQALEGWLGPSLGVARLLAVCPAEEAHTVALWRNKFGFKPISSKDLKQLQVSVPALNFYEEATLLAKPLAKPQRPKKQQPQQSQQQRSKHEPRPKQVGADVAVPAAAGATCTSVTEPPAASTNDVQQA